MSGMNTYNVVQGIGLVVAVAIAVLVACWFSDFWHDEPDYGLDQEQLMPVLIDHGNGMIEQTYVPTFGKTPVEEARDERHKSGGTAVLIVVAVLAVLAGAARG